MSVCVYVCVCTRACVPSLHYNRTMVHVVGKGILSISFLQPSRGQFPDVFQGLLLLLYVCIYNIPNYSFSNCTSVDTNSSCHLLQGSQYWGQEHFFFHKDHLQISCLYVWHFVNGGNAFYYFFLHEVDALGSF